MCNIQTYVYNIAYIRKNGYVSTILCKAYAHKSKQTTYAYMVPFPITFLLERECAMMLLNFLPLQHTQTHTQTHQTHTNHAHTLPTNTAHTHTHTHTHTHVKQTNNDESCAYFDVYLLCARACLFMPVFSEIYQFQAFSTPPTTPTAVSSEVRLIRADLRGILIRIN